jgi:hypothetical protein
VDDIDRECRFIGIIQPRVMEIQQLASITDDDPILAFISLFLHEPAF